jgi:serralysin
MPEPMDDRFCFAWFAPRAQDGDNRAALLDKARWASGTVITISFLDGDESLHERVAQAAKLWTAPGLANVIFAFRKGKSNTDIRISFQHRGSWSLIGTDCRAEKDLEKPTMNFGWLKDDSPDIELRSVVLHEFGHALGLIHEHQSPAGGIRWNKERVYQALSGPPYNWDPSTINANMFQPFEAHETNFTALDPRSIMMYPFPAEWTAGGMSTSRNTELSETDKKHIHKMYP